MSARLNMNTIPYIAWKGKTFTQVTSIIQKNKGLVDSSTSRVNLFKPNPLKIYRREIANIVNTNENPCNPRSSVRINELNMPNGYILYENGVNINRGLGANTIDINIPNSKYDTNKCNQTDSCFNHSSNALRRVRSSGNIKKKPYPDHNDTAYYTSSSQYLTSRNKTFQQNLFQYSLTKPTDPANNTIYCTPTYKPSNKQFAQQGAVSSSTLTHRKDYDTITKVGASFRTPYGAGMANAMAYGVPTPGYTIKDKIGYPLKQTPVVMHDGTLKNWCSTSFVHAI